MTIKTTPSFILRRVDPRKVLDLYVKGYYSTFQPIRTKINNHSTSSVLAPTYGTNITDPIHTYKERNGAQLILATSNYDFYKVYKDTKGSMPVGGRCRYCMRDFTHEAIGIPIKSDVVTLFDKTNNTERKLTIFWVDKIFCTYEHAYGFLLNELRKMPISRDINYHQSETLLKQMHAIEYPGAELRSPIDADLFDYNGGGITEKDLNNKHIYRRFGVHLLPAIIDHIRS